MNSANFVGVYPIWEKIAAFQVPIQAEFQKLSILSFRNRSSQAGTFLIRLYEPLTSQVLTELECVSPDEDDSVPDGRMHMIHTDAFNPFDVSPLCDYGSIMYLEIHVTTTGEQTEAGLLIEELVVQWTE